VPLTHVLMSAAVTVSVAGVSYAAFNPDRVEKHAREVAGQATCRTVDAAIVAYVALHDEAPRRTADTTTADRRQLIYSIRAGSRRGARA